MGTQVVNMSDCGSTLSPEILYDETVGLVFGCRDSPFVFHYYSIDISDIKIVGLYQKNVLEHSVQSIG